METQPNFFGVDIAEPLSKSLSKWDGSKLAELHKLSGGTVYLHSLLDHEHFIQVSQAPFAWRVVDAYYSVEDTTMTRFRAFGYDGTPLPFATFGVVHGGMQVSIKPGGMKYPAWENDYYIPVDGQIHTPNSGGYTVEVLDRNFPSERFSFGMHKAGEQHKALVISFRLFPFDATAYPNA